MEEAEGLLSRCCDGGGGEAARDHLVVSEGA